MGSPHIKNFNAKFIEKGLIPLEEITNAKQKVVCLDSEGYKYFLSYRGSVSDKRTKSFDRWNKNNPFKPYNMKLFVSITDSECEILSDDKELLNSTNTKILFRCPSCKNPYRKKWCHWIAQEKGKHTCDDCSRKRLQKEKIYTMEKLQEIYSQKGFTLLSDYQYYLDNGLSRARMSCLHSDGYKYAVNLTSLNTWKSGKDVRFSITNPYAKENLQNYCDKNKIEIKVLSVFEEENQTLFKLECNCKEKFISQAYKILSNEKICCEKCMKKESKIARLTRIWLEENNIEYIKECRFEDCKYKRVLPFDFKIEWKDKIILIEVDGQQHYYRARWMNEEKLILQKKKDEIKTEYCFKNGYILLRLPFWFFKTDLYKNKLNETFFG